MALGFVVARGAKSALDPLLFDGGLELHDAAVEGFLLGGGEVGTSAAAAAAVVQSSSQGKGRFKFRKVFFILLCWLVENWVS